MLQLFKNLFSKLKQSGSQKPYYHLMFRWLIPVNLQDVAKGLKMQFKVEEISLPENRFLAVNEFPFSERERIRFHADTLVVLLSPFRAILF